MNLFKSKMRPLLHVVAVSVLAVAGSSCGAIVIGDPSHDVYLHNATDVPVLLYEGARIADVPDARLLPSETRYTSWLVSTRSTTRRTVKALDETGQLIFCRRYDREELDRIGWRIEITRENRCE